MNTFLCRRDSGKWLEASRWVVFFSFFFSFSSLYRLSIGTSQHFTSRNQMDAVKKTKSNPGKLSKGKSFSYRYRREKVFDWLLWRVAQIASGKTKWNRGVYMFFFLSPCLMCYRTTFRWSRFIFYYTHKQEIGFQQCRLPPTEWMLFPAWGAHLSAVFLTEGGKTVGKTLLCFKLDLFWVMWLSSCHQIYVCEQFCNDLFRVDITIGYMIRALAGSNSSAY